MAPNPSQPLKVVYITADLADNSLGRTYCLWELSNALGWDSKVVSTRGERIWGPLENTRFAEDCALVEEDALWSLESVTDADIIIAVKPLPTSFGIALRLSVKSAKPLLLDIDDPDLEASLSWEKPLRRMGKSLLRRRRIAELKHMRASVRSVPVIVSNPVLAARYGGVVIPHIRTDLGPGRLHTSRNPTVAFVGSNRPHKGVELLRAAIARTQDLEYRLIVTDVAPADARPWETWIGSTTLEDGIRLVGESDVVVVPSSDVPFARGQLPAKLVDAMLLARAIVVTDIEPMPWAVGPGALVISADSIDAIELALRDLADPKVRTRIGIEARARALKTFTVGPNIAAFEKAVRGAVALGVRSTSRS
jgi:glycosyltransferase involved in cell wall biosynthesis